MCIGRPPPGTSLTPLLPGAFNALLRLRHRHLTRRYRLKIGRLPDYANPQRYSEKIQWRKIFDRNPLFPLFVDKFGVREFVARTAPGLELPEILWTGTEPDTIPYGSLPDRYVVKPNGRSGDWHFVLSSADADRDLISERCRRWLRRPYGRRMREWAYTHVVPRILIEELLCSESGGNRLQDFRFEVFDGRVRMITVTTAQIANTRRTALAMDTFYDRDWRQLPFIKPGRQTRAPAALAKPAQLGRMIDWSERLGTGLDYIRVDFYLVQDRAYFSELTVYPGSGLMLSRVSPEPGLDPVEDFDTYLSRHWRLPAIPGPTKLFRGMFA